MHSRTTVGWRFHPTHEELISHYLKPKMLGYDNEDLDIGEVDFCKFEPWDLPLQSKIKSDDLVWYFFCPHDRKYSRSRRFNRTTEAGYWKPTGKPLPVKDKHTNKEIGFKKILVFYKGRPQGVRTEWIMHEYEWTPEPNLEVQRDYILRKLKKKPCVGQSSRVASDSRHPTTFDSNSIPLTTNPACDESRIQPTDFDLGNQDPNSTYKEGEESSRMASDFGNQYPNYNFVISVPKEGDRSSLGGTPLDFDKDLCMKTDVSITDKNVWNSLDSLLQQNDVGEDWLLKISPELMVELGAHLRAVIEPESG